MQQSSYTPRHFIGIDWSGALDAGRRIQVAEGRLTGKYLSLTSLKRGEELPNSGRSRDRCLPALRDWLAARTACVVGLDFPFGLPRELVEDPDWMTFVRRFPSRFRTPETFREWCRNRSSGRELKRRTDMEARTPFSPYNLRMYRQTYWGITELLVPLLTRSLAVAPPMQPCRPDLPWLLEVCPASLLKTLGTYLPYKGRSMRHAQARATILEELLTRKRLRNPSPKLRERMLSDAGGDALDAVVAAVVATRASTDEALCRPIRITDPVAVEACVFYE